MQPEKPNFLIIGSAKCGTTSVYNLLDSHPQCCMSRPKEIGYFQDTLGGRKNPNFEKGWDWYKAAFSHYKGELAIGEATPAYSDRVRSPKTAQRIFEFNAEMRIVYLIRDPLDRQISAWKMQWAFPQIFSHESEWAKRGFEYWMEKQRENGQWSECRYSFQIDAYLKHFPAEQLFVSTIEMWRHSQAELYNLLRFLRLSNSENETNSPHFSNTAEDRRIEVRRVTNFFRSKPLRPIVRKLPLSWRNKWRSKILSRRVSLPPPQISEELKSEFLHYALSDTDHPDFPLDQYRAHWRNV